MVIIILIAIIHNKEPTGVELAFQHQMELIFGEDLLSPRDKNRT